MRLFALKLVCLLGASLVIGHAGVKPAIASTQAGQPEVGAIAAQPAVPLIDQITAVADLNNEAPANGLDQVTSVISTDRC